MFVENRTRPILEALIIEHIAPGSIIHSDSWGSYHNISNLPVNPPYTHQMVNHSVNFVDPVTGTHTQNIESYWNKAKSKLKRMNGCMSTVLSSHLDEFQWFELHGKADGIQTMENFFQHMSEWYPTV